VAIYDHTGNFVEDSPDGNDYFLSQDGLVKIDNEGYQVDSLGNRAFGDFSSPPQQRAESRPRWRPIQAESYRPPNFDIRLWRG
jgi:hypothetical protein